MGRPTKCLITLFTVIKLKFKKSYSWNDKFILQGACKTGRILAYLSYFGMLNAI